MWLGRFASLLALTGICICRRSRTALLRLSWRIEATAHATSSKPETCDEESGTDDLRNGHGRRPHKLAKRWGYPRTSLLLARLRVLFQPLDPASAIFRTFCGAVPPWLTRLFTEFSTLKTANTALVMRGSMACMAASGSCSSATPCVSAAFTIAPVT